MSTINVTLSKDQLTAVDEAAAKAKMSRQEYLQDALARRLGSTAKASAKASKPSASSATTTSSGKDKE